MWWSMQVMHKEGTVLDEGVRPLSALFNVLAEGSFVLVEALEKEQIEQAEEKSGKGRVGAAVRAGPVLDDSLHASILEAMSGNYFTQSVVVFGPNAPRVVEWIKKQKWKQTFSVFTFLETGEQIVRTFSFLDAGNPMWRGATEGDGRVCKIPHQINDYLFLGDYSAAANPAIIDLGVTHVVNASGGFENSFEDRLSYLSVNIWDSPTADVYSHFESAVEFLDSCRAQNGKALVHCAAGISRSTTLVLAYLMKREKMSLKDAFLLVKRVRNIVQPNSGFCHQLIRYEKELFGTNSVYVPPDHPSSSYLGLAELIRVDLEMSGMLTEEIRKLLLN